MPPSRWPHVGRSPSLLFLFCLYCSCLYFSIGWPVCLSFFLAPLVSVHPPVCLSVFIALPHSLLVLSVCLSLSLPIFLVCLFVRLSVYLSVCLFVFPSLFLSSFCMYACLSVCLAISHLSLSFPSV